MTEPKYKEGTHELLKDWRDREAYLKPDDISHSASPRQICNSIAGTYLQDVLMVVMGFALFGTVLTMLLPLVLFSIVFHPASTWQTIRDAWDWCVTRKPKTPSQP